MITISDTRTEDARIGELPEPRIEELEAEWEALSCGTIESDE